MTMFAMENMMAVSQDAVFVDSIGVSVSNFISRVDIDFSRFL